MKNCDFLMGALFGVAIGLLLALGLNNVDDGAYVSKDKLRNKESISMTNCYAQYSAVRRFPK